VTESVLQLVLRQHPTGFSEIDNCKISNDLQQPKNHLFPVRKVRYLQ